MVGVGEYGIDVRWAHSLPGNQQRGVSLTASVVRTITSWGLRQACREVGNVHRVRGPRHWQGMHREQENSHLE